MTIPPAPQYDSLSQETGAAKALAFISEALCSIASSAEEKGFAPEISGDLIIQLITAAAPAGDAASASIEATHSSDEHAAELFHQLCAFALTPPAKRRALTRHSLIIQTPN